MGLDAETSWLYFWLYSDTAEAPGTEQKTLHAAGTFLHRADRPNRIQNLVMLARHWSWPHIVATTPLLGVGMRRKLLHPPTCRRPSCLKELLEQEDHGEPVPTILPTPRQRWPTWISH
ncbi:hypothetical protein DPEC_G00228490 [Dallia pectoralis]|uniref:Uncharacterized protein n=1 Tax=Dallia pectoralis TaxID=75939 RepID=A0ACC2G1I2_DALPE|nr:hypothetical protein DPEC_G00228490 [Dallia pectoralis]